MVSVGNLTLGGTGKSPVVHYLVQRMMFLQKKAAVISRGYKRENQYADIVNTKTENAGRVYGDEPIMLAMKNPESPVVVSANRVASTKLIKEKFEDVDVIISDDSFQHRKIQRNLDIVLIDASQPLSDLMLFPLGRARECLDSLKRADVLFLTKVNFSSREKREQIDKKIKPYLRDDVSVFFVKMENQEVYPLLDSTKKEKIFKMNCKKVALLCGIANPHFFKSSFEQKWGEKVSKTFFYPDHHVYNEDEVAQALLYCKQHKIDRLIVTEKDAVKISEFKGCDLEKVWVAGFDLSFENSCDERKLDEILLSVF